MFPCVPAEDPPKEGAEERGGEGSEGKGRGEEQLQSHSPTTTISQHTERGLSAGWMAGWLAGWPAGLAPEPVLRICPSLSLSSPRPLLPEGGWES